MSTVASRTRNRYSAGRTAWREFCDGMQVPPRLDPPKEGWGGILLYFFTCEHRIFGVGYSGSGTRYSAIRFVHLIE